MMSRETMMAGVDKPMRKCDGLFEKYQDGSRYLGCHDGEAWWVTSLSDGGLAALDAVVNAKLCGVPDEDGSSGEGADVAAEVGASEENDFVRKVPCEKCGGSGRVSFEPLDLKTSPVDPMRCTRCGLGSSYSDKRCDWCEQEFPLRPIMWVRGVEWGIIVPGSSGVLWVHQTNGCGCSHPVVEGAFLELPTTGSPKHIGDEYRRESALELIREIGRVNYCAPTQQPDGELWSRIKRIIGFDFELCEPPEGAPKYHGSQEAWWWVRLKVLPEEWQDGLHKLDALLGKTVLLVYPNSD